MPKILRFFDGREVGNPNTGGLLLRLDLEQTPVVDIPKAGDTVVLPVRHEARSKEYVVLKVVHRIFVDDPGIEIYVEK